MSSVVTWPSSIMVGCGPANTSGHISPDWLHVTSITAMFYITPALAVHPYYYSCTCEVYGWGNSGAKQSVGIIAAPECDLSKVCNMCLEYVTVLECCL